MGQIQRKKKQQRRSADRESRKTTFGIPRDFYNMDVSENSGTPKSSNLIGFSIINHPFWGTSIFGNTHTEILGDTI